MTFSAKDYRQIRADILRDITNQQPSAYTGEDSDFAARANAVASCIEGLYEHQKWILRQVFPDSADSDYLERHASLRGIARKAAASATGAVRFSGTSGSGVPIGTEAKTSSGIVFVTSAAGVIGAGGSVDVAAHAVLAGTAGNLAASTALTLGAAPAGVQQQASIVTMTGGADVETDAALLARVLYDIRMPPTGGAKHDYYAWAMEVAGVTDAYVFTQRRTSNGVDVVIEAQGGLSSPQLIADVTAYIDARRPVCTDLLVLTPTLVTVDVAAALTLSGATLADAAAGINSVLAAYIATLHVGEAVTRARLISLMMGVRGVADVNLTTPAANVNILADQTHSQIGVLGVVTLT